MDIIISNANDQPIYEQIYRQIRDAIMNGRLLEGDALPSIRQLAKDLRISVITTKRAYDELEKDGYIDTVAAKGSFVAAQNTQMLREAHLRKIEGLLSQVAALARVSGLSAGEIAQMYLLAADEEETEK